MNDLAVVHYLLTHNGPLNAVVAAANVVSGPLPQNTAVPAIGLAHLSTTRPQNVKAASGLAVSRVQVTAVAALYGDAKSIIDLVRGALPRSRGTVDNVFVESVVLDIEGPDFFEEEPALYISSIDVMVTHQE